MVVVGYLIFSLDPTKNHMPAIIRTPGVVINKDTNFVVSEKQHDKKRRAPLAIDGTNGSNAAIAYEGQQDTDQKYCLVVRDRKSNKLDLVEVPVFEVTPYVKTLRQHDLENVIRQSGVKNWEQRTALGEAFGTKKAKTAINDVSRNRLDADMLEGLESAIVENVDARTANLPSSEQRQQTAEADRPIPPYNAETSKVSEIYPLENIVPLAELDLVLPLVDELMAAPEDERLDKLPFAGSDFINAHVIQVLSEESNIRARLQVLIYLSFLRAFYQNRRATSRQSLVEKIGSVPSALFDGALQRFTVVRAGQFGQSRDRSFTVDPFHQDKLLCYMLALSLHANNFEVDVTPLAHELSVKSSKLVNLLRNLGAISHAPSAAEAKARELPSGTASSYRIAELKAPLKLPDIVKRKRA